MKGGVFLIQSSSLLLFSPQDLRVLRRLRAELRVVIRHMKLVRIYDIFSPRLHLSVSLSLYLSISPSLRLSIPLSSLLLSFHQSHLADLGLIWRDGTDRNAPALP